MAAPGNDAALRDALTTARTAMRAGDATRAHAAYRAALALDAGHPEALHALAREALARDAAAEAVTLLQRAIERLPDAALLHADLAAALQATGANAEAVVAAERSLALQPGEPAVLLALGNALRGLGRAPEAVVALRQACERAPRAAILHFHLAGALVDAGEREAAVESLLRTLAIDPTAIEPAARLGLLLAELGRHEQAQSLLESVAERQPRAAAPRVWLARIALDRGDAPRAEALAREALTRDEGDAEAWNTLGTARRAQGDPDGAAAAYANALERSPDFVIVHVNLANTELDAGRFERARTCAERALTIAPESADARWVIAQVALACGEWREGWPAYEARLGKTGARELAHPFPRWNGAALREGALFVTAEQGVGDEIFFAAELRGLEAFAPRVVAECDARLVPLFARSFPALTFIARLAAAADYPASLPAPAATVPIGSLPGLRHGDRAALADGVAYLRADEARVATWRERFAALGARKVIGISWRGGKEPLVQRARTIALTAFAPLAAREDVALVNLQYGDCAADLDAARAAGVHVHDFTDADPLRDLDGAAAQIAALDAVVSVDNTTVHLSGALGVPTTVLLPYVADWRWQRERADSPWYAALRLERQQTPGEWSDVLARVARAL